MGEPKLSPHLTFMNVKISYLECSSLSDFYCFEINLSPT